MEAKKPAQERLSFYKVEPQVQIEAGKERTVLRQSELATIQALTKPLYNEAVDNSRKTERTELHNATPNLDQSTLVFTSSQGDVGDS